LVQDRGARLAWGAARAAVGVGLPRFLESRGRRGWAKGIKIGCAIVGGAVVAHNAVQLARGR